MSSSSSLPPRTLLTDLPPDCLDTFLSYLPYIVTLTSIRSISSYFNQLICQNRLHSTANVRLCRGIVKVVPSVASPPRRRFERSAPESWSCSPSGEDRRGVGEEENDEGSPRFVSGTILRNFADMPFAHQMVRGITISNLFEEENGVCDAESSNVIQALMTGQRFSDPSLSYYFDKLRGNSTDHVTCLRFIAVRFQDIQTVFDSIRKFHQLRTLVFRDCWIQRIMSVLGRGLASHDPMDFPNLEFLELCLRDPEVLKEEIGFAAVARVYDRAVPREILEPLLEILCGGLVLSYGSSVSTASLDLSRGLQIVLRSGSGDTFLGAELSGMRLRSLTLISPEFDFATEITGCGGDWVFPHSDIFANLRELSIRDFSLKFCREALTSSLLCEKFPSLDSLVLRFPLLPARKSHPMAGVDDQYPPTPKSDEEEVMEEVECSLFAPNARFESHPAMRRLTLSFEHGGDLVLAQVAKKFPHLTEARLNMGRITVGGLVSFVAALSETLMELTVVENDWHATKLCSRGLLTEIEQVHAALKRVFVTGKMTEDLQHLLEDENRLSFEVTVYEGESWGEKYWDCPLGCGTRVLFPVDRAGEVISHIHECLLCDPKDRARVPLHDTFWGLRGFEEEESFIWHCPLDCGFSFTPENGCLVNGVAIEHLRECPQNVVVCPCCSTGFEVHLSGLQEHLNSSECAGLLFEGFPRWERRETFFKRTAPLKDGSAIRRMSSFPEGQFDDWKARKIPKRWEGAKSLQWRLPDLNRFCGRWTEVGRLSFFMGGRLIEDGPILTEEAGSVEEVEGI